MALTNKTLETVGPSGDATHVTGIPLGGDGDTLRIEATRIGLTGPVRIFANDSHINRPKTPSIAVPL
jgi:hypothetical protein